ncbi:uncharacterized protein LOC118186677 [Stegodyphus dumicola]|uniref:uncharacterized protein LOC118186677 n=1 Tax=Stegodyphus dumicola TaxID=202533 RepID=UPI0015AFC57E|nr:uncharacterized protein LOC118186677 [Stegodyphus dumicola]
MKVENVKSKSKLASLNCFLDKNVLIRVGRQITNSSVNDNIKHPIVLSSKHPLTYMIVEYFHLKYLHAGSQTLLYLIRQRYWSLNGMKLCRLVIHNSVMCTKNKEIVEQQLTDQLPKERIEPSPPFTVTGIDFCGPFYVKFKRQRNFIGADAELKRLLKIVISPDEQLVQYFTEETIDWHFNPPGSPNFGGLYEAGVKSFKYHLKRLAGNSYFTLEEFITVLAEIEGVLNSRPLTSLSADFDNFETLTPGHFLIESISQGIFFHRRTPTTDINENRLSKWEKVPDALRESGSFGKEIT